MLLNRIDRSLDRILEGLDTCNVRIILEANQEFDASVKEMAKMADNFLQAFENGIKTSKSDHNEKAKPVFEAIKNLADQLKKVKTDKVPEKFSFAAAEEMRDSDSDNAVAQVSMAAAQLDVLFKATKDAIIAVARGIEKIPIFSVGSQGILIAKEFAVMDGEPEDVFSLVDLLEAGTNLEDCANKLAGTTDEGWKEKFANVIKQAAEELKLDLATPDGKQKAEDAFLKTFKDSSTAVSTALDKIPNELGKLEPNEGLKKATQESGFFKTLLKEKNPYQIDANMAKSIVESVICLSLKGLFTLTQDLIKMTGNVDAAISDAADRVQTAAEAQDPEKAPDQAEALHSKIVEEVPLDPLEATAILGVAEKTGYDNEKDEDFRNVDAKTAAPPMQKMTGDKFEKLEDVTNLATGEDESDDPEDVVSVMDDAVEEVKDNPELDAGDAVNIGIDNWEQQLSDRQKERINAKPRGGKEGRLDQLKRMVGEVTPPESEPPTDPQEVAVAADDWGKEHRITDPKSPIGNPKSFSPKQMNKLIDLLPQVVKDVESAEDDGIDNDGDGETDEEGETQSPEEEESATQVKDSLYRRWGELAGIITS